MINLLATNIHLRSNYEVIYKQLCKEANCYYSRNLDNEELLYRINLFLIEYNCKPYTQEEIQFILKQMQP